jgi:hypothetical protein
MASGLLSSSNGALTGGSVEWASSGPEGHLRTSPWTSRRALGVTNRTRRGRGRSAAMGAPRRRLPLSLALILLSGWDSGGHTRCGARLSCSGVPPSCAQLRTMGTVACGRIALRLSPARRTSCAPRLHRPQVRTVQCAQALAENAVRGSKQAVWSVCVATRVLESVLDDAWCYARPGFSQSEE